MSDIESPLETSPEQVLIMEKTIQKLSSEIERLENVNQESIVATKEKDPTKKQLNALVDHINNLQSIDKTKMIPYGAFKNAVKLEKITNSTLKKTNLVTSILITTLAIFMTKGLCENQIMNLLMCFAANFATFVVYYGIYVFIYYNYYKNKCDFEADENQLYSYDVYNTFIVGGMKIDKKTSIDSLKISLNDSITHDLLKIDYPIIVQLGGTFEGYQISKNNCISIRIFNSSNLSVVKELEL